MFLAGSIKKCTFVFRRVIQLIVTRAVSLVAYQLQPCVGHQNLILLILNTDKEERMLAFWGNFLAFVLIFIKYPPRLFVRNIHPLIQLTE